MVSGNIKDRFGEARSPRSGGLGPAEVSCLDDEIGVRVGKLQRPRAQVHIREDIEYHAALTVSTLREVSARHESTLSACLQVCMSPLRRTTWRRSCPIVLERELPGRGTPVDAEPAFGELATQLACHLRIAADHDPGVLWIECDTRGLFEPTVFDQARNAHAERTRKRLPRDDWYIPPPTR